ncbi:early light-induced protein 1, chloroplastic [Nicotiana tabacum]|uniref:Early light-induced protein 1, chloroplastic n=1 Tax=Nicotiana tabacum TaxID=4097 RepID=A0A1S4CVV6_TOBAC|nr:PREDICTED: early light-induced protein 1, chloroplastic-like [Nicotiana tabacum]
MAICGGMQSMILGSPIVSKRNGVNQFVPCCNIPRPQRNSTLSVKCMSEDGEKGQTSNSLNDIATTPTPTPTPIPTPRPVAKTSTKFGDLFAFSGPAPERINGRLAMIGFVAALGAEFANGGDIFAQLSSGGFSWFLGTSALLTLASLIPLFQGIRAEKKYTSGIMSADAEIWNGRFAMLGLVALAFTEYVKGGAFLQV